MELSQLDQPMSGEVEALPVTVVVFSRDSCVVGSLPATTTTSSLHPFFVFVFVSCRVIARILICLTSCIISIERERARTC